jgi:Asp/Glu/hydantoin racemase
LGGPLVLQNQEDIDRSTEACLHLLPSVVEDYDAFLLACYADHPLVAQLQSQVGSKPVVGIFEASVQAALDALEPSRRFAILTTGKAFEKQLEAGVERLIGKAKAKSCFAGVFSTGISICDLAEASQETVKAKIKAGVERVLAKCCIGAICIGGVILSGTEPIVSEACKGEVGNESGGEIIVINQLETGTAAVTRALHLQ